MGAEDNYDFTTLIYAPSNIKMTDVEAHEILMQKVKLQKKQAT